MKNILLHVAILFAFLPVKAQNIKHPSVICVNNEQKLVLRQSGPHTSSHLLQKGMNAKTTNGGSRWYNYPDYINLVGLLIDSYPTYFWHRDNSLWAYGAPSTFYDTGHVVSLGMVLDPFASGFNDTNYYNGIIGISSGDSYVFDSVAVYGLYPRPKPNVTDTLRFSFFYGNGSSSSNIFTKYLTYDSSTQDLFSDYSLSNTDTLFTVSVKEDSMLQLAASVSAGPTIITQDFILDSSVVGDTLSDGTSYFQVKIPGSGINIPAGNWVGCTYTFISGDASFVPLDTVWLDNNNNNSFATNQYKYNVFRPITVCHGVLYPAFFPNYYPPIVDANTGLFEIQPNDTWPHEYTSTYLLTSGPGVASILQYPSMDFHLSCMGCSILSRHGQSSTTNVNMVTTIRGYPSPARDALYVSFNLNQASNVNISISDLLGRKLISNNVENVVSGSVKFDISSLANGIYLYTLNANGTQRTERFIIEH